METTKTKLPSESETIKTEVVCPNDTNPMGILQGGQLVQWMDIAAAVCAQVHAEKICITASIDGIDFKAPAKLGDIITIKAKVTRAFTSSMEIFVRACVKNVTNKERTLLSEAYFTFVVLDKNTDPTVLPVLKLETKEEKELYDQALERKRRKTKVLRDLRTKDRLSCN
jgi:acyl-CoA hydrolase